MAEVAGKQRPQFRNIHITQIVSYRLPAAGVMSILHRVSGLGLFLMLPFLLYLLDLSLKSEISFSAFSELTSNVFVKLLLCGLSWAYLHHFCAGIRHLIADLHIGVDKVSGAKWAIGVFAVSLPLAALVALRIFGVF